MEIYGLSPVHSHPHDAFLTSLVSWHSGADISFSSLAFSLPCSAGAECQVGWVLSYSESVGGVLGY